MSDAFTVLTHFASPYQCEFFDEVARRWRDRFTVYYLHRSHPTRGWVPPECKHRARFFDESPKVLVEAREHFHAAQMAVFNFYTEAPAAELLELRAQSGRPWAFWGERPGYHSHILGRWMRRWRLGALRESSSPVWGIGRWAVDAYREEFGPERHYVNLPYFSDLRPFQSQRPTPASTTFTFLYSGSLSKRKGVDLLAQAFNRLADRERNVRLKIVGTGDMESSMKQRLSRHSDRVEWVGFRQWNKLPYEYGTAQALCVPSRYDGWGLVVPEGLASGLPVLATSQTGSALDFVEDDVNGWLVPAKDEDALFESMRSAAALSSQQWRDMSEQARESVRLHTLLHGARRFINAAESAIKEHDGRRYGGSAVIETLRR